MADMTREEFAEALKAAGVKPPAKRRLERYLSRPEVAERLGVLRQTVGRYRLPPPDVYVGELPGWAPATIDAWNAARPGRGKSWGSR